MTGEPSGARVHAYVVNVGAFIWHQGRYLMMVRGAGEEIAPGALTQPGGKIELSGYARDVIEATLASEVREEVGVEVADAVYVESHTFDGTFDGAVLPVLDLVFLCRYVSGEPHAEDCDEVAGIEWLTPDELGADPRVQPWTMESFERAEAVRMALGWG
ncbi:MAG: NUDIX domain-containing protein [Chloroflexi bacterium]|nr:NUDIX domain-containing protein [Chloroflexota bacterium]